MSEDRQRRRRRPVGLTLSGYASGGTRMLFLVILLVFLPSEAFLSTTYNPSSYSKRHSAPIQSTAAAPPEATSFQSLEDFNKHLERIADKCGSFKEPVIALATECEQIWEREQHHQDNDENQCGPNSSFQPDLSSFQTMLKAWNKCTQTLAKSRRDGVTVPSEDSTDLVIDIYTPLDAVKHATSLLLAYPDPGLQSYQIVMEAWSKSKVAEAADANERLMKRIMDDKSIQPDTTCFNLLIDSWADSGRPNSLEKVKQIYKHMEGLHENGNTHVVPTIRTINAVLHAHAKQAAKLMKENNLDGFMEAEKCAQQAYGILQEAKRKYEETKDIAWQPDVATYTSCIDVHARCGSYNASRTATDLLDELNQLYTTTKNGNYQPNFRTYTAVITAWSRTRSDESPQQVERLMEEMANSPITKPNARTYTAAIQCWARSKDPLKAKRVLKLLMEMREIYKETRSSDIRPNTVTYNVAIDACARCQGTEQQKTEAMKIAFAFLKTVEMDEHCSPDSCTYATLIRAVTFLMPSGNARNKVAMSVFEKAKKEGVVDFTAVRNLRRAVDSETMGIALEGRADRNGSFNYDDLPPSWSRKSNE